MSILEPTFHRTNIRDKLPKILDAKSPEELRQLVARAGVPQSDDTQEALEQLVRRGGFLLVELGLVRDPEVTNGTVFSVGGLEYVISHEAAQMLRDGTGSARVWVIGGGKSRTFAYAELVKALVESVDFDQLRVR